MTFIKLSVGGHDVIVSSDPLLLTLLDKIEKTIESRDLDLALREVDRAWRTLPEYHSTLAPVFARLMFSQCGNFSASINLYLRALEADACPELEGELIQVLLNSGQHEAARSRLTGALQKYALLSDSRLAQCARQVIAYPTQAFSGWVGVDPTLKIYAEADMATPRRRFELFSEDGICLSTCDSKLVDGRSAAYFEVPPDYAHRLVSIRTDNGLLLGGNRLAKAFFDADGRVFEKQGLIKGWVRLGWNPRSPQLVRITDQKGRNYELAASDPTPGSRWEFRVDLRKTELSGGVFVVSVLLPDGTWQPFPDSPLICESTIKKGLRAISPKLRPMFQEDCHEPPPNQVQRLVSVIVPVYKDRERTLGCIEAILRTTEKHSQSIIVVDDATPDQSLAEDLNLLAASGQIKLIRNRHNLGFAASVNRAMALHEDHDAVLVNSDVIVFEGWLKRLRDAAYRNPRVGTVTPFADDNSIVGYVSSLEESGRISASGEFDRFAATANRGVSLEIPVGVGFCLFIRRDCWNEVGEFDSAVFDAGYGEEADFCMRARELNWHHHLAADVFVHHSGGRSFGTRREALIDRSQRLLNLRHPGYDQFVASFISRDLLRPFRRSFDLQRLNQLNGEIVLILTLAQGLNGGIERFVAERSRRIRAEGRIPLLLRPLKSGVEGCLLQCEDLQLGSLSFQVPSELRELREVLLSLKLVAIEIHNFLGHSPRLVSVVRRLGVPYDTYLHDYSWICPRITLIDGSLSYCGEPKLAACERCIELNGADLFERISVRALRRRSTRLLAGSRRVVAPSNDTANRFKRYISSCEVDVVPHETFVLAGPNPQAGERVTRIALLGAIGQHKGYQILLNCARDAVQRKLDLEFVVIGYTDDDARLIKTGKVFVTGEYDDNQLSMLLNQQRPHAVFLPSVWPETWSYTLSHAIRSGLPVVAFDIGAIAERMRAEGVGTLLPLRLTPGSINDRLIGLSN